jgi:hypothetical protein
MTDRIKEIKQRLEKASPGPWKVPAANVHRVIAIKDGNPYLLIVEHPEEHAFFGKDDLSYFRLGSEGGGKQSAANAQFIAHAPDDIRYLLAELKKAREEITRSALREKMLADKWSKETIELGIELEKARRRLAGIEACYAKWKHIGFYTNADILWQAIKGAQEGVK